VRYLGAHRSGVRAAKRLGKLGRHAGADRCMGEAGLREAAQKEPTLMQRSLQTGKL